MKRPSKYAIIGAGGIGCNLAQMLCREGDIVIIDKDNYEPDNAARQFPALHSTENKAMVLAEWCRKQTLNKVEHINDYLKNTFIRNHPEFDGVDMLIGCVDNNASRGAIIKVAECMEIPAILAGNEHEHGEAHLFIPEIYNPFDHFEFQNGEPPPWGCNTEKTLSEFPQTAIANIMAAGCAMHILLSWFKVNEPRNCIVYSRNDALSSTYKRAKDLLATATPA